MAFRRMTCLQTKRIVRFLRNPEMTDRYVVFISHRRLKIYLAIRLVPWCTIISVSLNMIDHVLMGILRIRASFNVSFYLV